MSDRARRKALFGVAFYNWSETQRMQSIAKYLSVEGWDIYVLGSGKYDHLLNNQQYTRVFIPHDEQWYTEDRIAKMMNMERYGGDIGTIEEIKNIVEGEIQLMREIMPSVLITGYRLTFTISARILNIPLIYCMSAVMSKPYLAWLGEFSRMPLEEQKKHIEDRSRECSYEDILAVSRLLGKSKTTITSWKSILMKYGKDFMVNDSDLYCGDLTLMTDARELFSQIEDNQQFKFIGPIYNYENYPIPHIEEHKCNILVTLGSSCSPELLKLILNSLENITANIYVTSNDMMNEEEKRCYSDKYHFYEKLALYDVAKKCNLTILHGGQGSIYNVLKAGCPVLSIPQAFEQRHNIENILLHYKCGRMIYGKNTTEKNIEATVLDLLSNSKYKVEAQRISKLLLKYDDEGLLAPQKAVLLIHDYLTHRSADLSKNRINKGELGKLSGLPRI